MAIGRSEIKNIVESEGPLKAAQKIRRLVGVDPIESNRFGIEDPQRFGERTLGAHRRMRPNEFSILSVFEAFTGLDGTSLERAMMSPGAMNVMEDAGTIIGPSQFSNISAANAAALGLLEARFLERWKRDDLIADQLCELMPSEKIRELIIGVSDIGDVANIRKPGNAHVRIPLSERFVVFPNVTNYGVAVEVTREAVMYDRTRDLLAACDSAADTLALRKEYRCLQVVVGQQNTYTYGGTNYNTFIASGGNWVNKLSGNDLQDWTEINTAMQLFTRMRSQETGQPVEVRPRDLLVNAARYWNARNILFSTDVQRRVAYATDNSGLNNSGGAGPANLFNAPNPVKELGLNLLGSETYPYLNRALTNPTDDPIAPGLGLTQAQADAYWWTGDFKGAFGYAQTLPLTIEKPTVQSYTMADHGIVFALFADEAGTPGVKEPRKVVQSYNN